MGSWFPLSMQMMEDNRKFRELTPHEKLYYWCVLSEMNKPRAKGHQPYYRADIEFAVMLGIGEAKIRVARRKLGKLGFIRYRSGFRTGRKNIATTYLSAKWAKTPKKGSGIFFAQMHRYTFEVIIDHLHLGVFSARDVVAYVYLAYWYWKHGRYGDYFYISKAQLCELSRIPSAPLHVKRISAVFKFADGNKLFEYVEKHHNFKLSKWLTCADPSEDENNRNTEKARKTSLDADIKAAKAQAHKKAQAAAKKRDRKKQKAALSVSR